MMSNRERLAKLLEAKHPQLAEKFRAGMTASTWPKDLIDPGILLEVFEAAFTPAARWREEGKPDPTPRDYERARLPLGQHTDDEIANAAYLAIGPMPREDVANAAKQRMRWLSRRLAEAEAKLASLIPLEVLGTSSGGTHDPDVRGVKYRADERLEYKPFFLPRFFARQERIQS